MSDDKTVMDLYSSFMASPHFHPEDVARLEVSGNRVVGSHLVPGLNVDVNELDDGIEANISVDEGVAIPKPVRLCFGLLPEKGRQRILINAEIKPQAKVDVVAHCTFPNAVDVEHVMDAGIVVAEGAEYSYFERHVHGREGGVRVIPKTRVTVKEGGRFKTEFELIKGRVGLMDIDIETVCQARAVMDMTARISGRGDDKVKIREAGRLVGERAVGVLTSYIALRDRAEARIENDLIAEAAFCRGHVDCKEIVQDEAVAAAIPVVEVRHPKAHVTHEASIGSVDSKQLQTLMSRGLTEDDAVELIIQGLLRRRASD